jgi:hypothetical protein
MADRYAVRTKKVAEIMDEYLLKTLDGLLKNINRFNLEKTEQNEKMAIGSLKKYKKLYNCFMEKKECESKYPGLTEENVIEYWNGKFTFRNNSASPVVYIRTKDCVYAYLYTSGKTIKCGAMPKAARQKLKKQI